MKYGLKQLRKDFPTERACLEFIFETLHSYECACGGEYVAREGRKQYQCSKCRFHIAPTANTLFHKSDTPLTLWFHALWVFSNAKSGVSAKEMERQLAVTYKTASCFFGCRSFARSLVYVRMSICGFLWPVSTIASAIMEARTR